MGKMSLLFVMMFLLSIMVVSGYEPHQQNTNFSFAEEVANADACNLTYIEYPDGTTADLNIALTKAGFTFKTTILSGNFTQLGDVKIGIICYDSDATPQYESDEKGLTVTSSGESPTLSNAIANLILIFFLIFLVVAVFLTTKKINYESWHNSIIRKYENRNYVKLVLGSIGYNLMKNTYLIYYLLLLPLLLSITNMVYSFGISSMITIIQVLFAIYLVGILVVGLYFIGHVQEWLIDLLNKIRDMDWGVE